MGSLVLPEYVRDSRLEALFQPNSNLPTVTIHIKASGRRNAPREEVWVREKLLGQGGYGMVWLERNPKSSNAASQLRAVKQIRVNQSILESAMYKRELEALAKFSLDKYCDSFVKSYGWYESPDPEWLFIAMEYCQFGDMKKYIAQQGRLPEDQGRDIAAQLLHGLLSMHENGFAHRDFKPANVLIKRLPPDEWWVKICDFGLSKRIGEATASTLRGTPGYIPPEMLDIDGDVKDVNPFSADMWSFGETIFYMLTRQPTFNPVTLYQYKKGLSPYPSEVLVNVGASEGLINFLRSLMAPDPAERISAAQADDHVWIRAPAKPAESVLSSLEWALSSDRSPAIANGSLHSGIQKIEQDVTLPSGSWTNTIHINAPDQMKHVSFGRSGSDVGANLHSSTVAIQRPIQILHHPPRPQPTQNPLTDEQLSQPDSAMVRAIESYGDIPRTGNATLGALDSTESISPIGSIQDSEATEQQQAQQNIPEREGPIVQSENTQTAGPTELDILSSFKQFSALEKLRMKRKPEKTREEILNDLKRFAQQFKLHTPVPSDLVPIIKKGERKLEIIPLFQEKIVEQNQTVKQHELEKQLYQQGDGRETVSYTQPKKYVEVLREAKYKDESQQVAGPVLPEKAWSQVQSRSRKKKRKSSKK